MKGAFALIFFVIVLAGLVYAQNLDVRIYTETGEGIKDFGTIKAKPGDQINAFIEIENENQDRSDEDQEIEDIEVKLTIEEINKGEDIEEDFDTFDLRPRRKKSLSFSFTVPFEVEDMLYDILIEIEYSEADEDFLKRYDFSVNVNKEKHKLYFEKLEFEPEKVKCNSVSYINIELYNLGTENEDVIMNIKNDELKFSIQRGLLLEEYPGNAIYRNIIPIKIPLGAETGIYSFAISLSYDKLSLNKLLNLDIDCGQKTVLSQVEKKDTEEQKKESVENVEALVMPITRDTAKLKIIVKKRDNIPLAGLFILIGLIIIGIIIVSTLKKRQILTTK